MYKFEPWTFKRNFVEDPLTKNLTKVKNAGIGWNARAYYQDAFLEVIENGGLKNYHNVNPGKDTEYAVGFSTKELNSVFQPSDLEYGFYYHGDYVDLIDDGTTVLTLTEANVVYQISFNKDGYLEYFENGVLKYTSSQPITLFALHAFVLSYNTFETDLEVTLNLDGTISRRILDVTWEKIEGQDSTEISLFANPNSLPPQTLVLKVHTETVVNETSISNDNVKLYRFIRPGEDPTKLGLPENATKVELNITVPYQWSSQNFFQIFTTEIDVGDTFQLVIGTEEQPLVEVSKWKELWDYFQSRRVFDPLDKYAYLSDEEFIHFVTDSFFNDPNYFDEPDFNYHLRKLGRNILGPRWRFVREMYSDANNLGYLTDPSTYIPSTVIFKSTGTRSIEDTVTSLNTFFNDIYFKARNIDTLIDVDRIVKESSKLFDFEYFVTEYDAENKTYNKIYDEERDRLGYNEPYKKINFENSKVIEELFVKQYLPEYQNYSNIINTDELTLLTSEERTNLKSLIYKNVTLMNYFKGNRSQIKFLVSVFSGSLGYYYVSVDPDPYDNFVYRVSSTLPKKYWTTVLKDITHPLGWVDFYVEVPKDKNAWVQDIYIDETTFEDYFILNSTTNQTSYLDISKFVDETGDPILRGTYTENAISDEFLSEKNFPFAESEYYANQDYQTGSPATDNTGLFYDLMQSAPEIVVTVDATTGLSIDLVKNGGPNMFSYYLAPPFLKLKLRQSGIASEYIWEVYNKGVLVQRHKTFVPFIVLPIKSNEKYTIYLKLKHLNEFSMIAYDFEVNTYTHPNFYNDKYFSWVVNSYLDKETSDKFNRYDSILVGDSGEEKEVTHKDGVLDFVLDDTSINNIVSSLTIDTTNDLHTVYWNDSTDSEFNQNHISGLFDEFVWIIRNGTSVNDFVINKFKTTIPNFYYKPAVSRTRNIQLILKKQGKEYIGPNKII